MKVNRHVKIVELVNKYDIETQEELADRLRDEGFQITQATVSRDIRDLKLTKVATDDGRQKYVVLKATENALRDKYIRILKDGFVSMDMAMNILVIKTVSGMAMAVAAAIDEMRWNEVVGCIAGDDTIFCVARSSSFCKEIIADIKKVASDDMLEG